MIISLDDKLCGLKHKKGNIKVMLIGLGSVGNYLLDYLCSLSNPSLEIIIVGRNYKKIESDVNVIKVASNIRCQLKSKIIIQDGCDLDNIESIVCYIQKYEPDIIVNTSRAFTGLKYGSISWDSLRAYGIWAPLSIKYIRNIMIAIQQTQCNAIVINTSYSDITSPWLKSAGLPYPDFGSGNLNHLIPRIRFAAARLAHISDYWNIDVTIATGHFHDVVISKEGQNEGVDQLIHIWYKGEGLFFNQNELLKLCKIEMPTDAKRNMMNASSNFEIIMGILNSINNNTYVRLHSPGVLGELGGYPLIIDSQSEQPKAYIDESVFSIEKMRQKNQLSMALDGIEKIDKGILYYTDELIMKVENKFNVRLPKTIHFNEIDEVGQYIIEKIILKVRQGGMNASR